GLADLLQRVLENPDVAVAIEAILGNPGFAGALLEGLDDLVLSVEAPISDGENIAFEQTGRHALEHFRRPVGPTIADRRNGAFANMELVHLIESEFQVGDG